MYVNNSILIRSKESQRLLRFLVVGLGGTMIDFSLLTVFRSLGLPILPANSISFVAGIVNNFVWNRWWTFAELSRPSWNKQFVQFLLVSLVGLLMNNLLVLALTEPFETWSGSWGYIPAKVIATGVVVFWNYFANRYWTFRN